MDYFGLDILLFTCLWHVRVLVLNLAAYYYFLGTRSRQENLINSLIRKLHVYHGNGLAARFYKVSRKLCNITKIISLTK